MSSIEVKGLTKVFSTTTGPLKILDDVSFTVAEGEFVCLLGPSGSGKSVTLNCISGLLPATSGTVIVDGVPVTQKKPSYGYVFQQPRLMPWRTVQDNLRFALRAETGKQVPDEDKRIQDVLELVNLSGYENFYPHQISGGMQHRVGIARAYVRDPGLLMMDEPFGALDEMTARRLRAELVTTWLRDRRTVVFVTHDIVEACYLADRIVIYTPKPTRIAEIIEVKLPRPREYGSPEMHEIESQVLAVFERTMKDFMQIIKDEHRAMASVFNEFIVQVDKCESGEEPDFALLDSMIFYLNDFPERLHHPKEDEYLFAALAMRSPSAIGLIEETKDEHKLGGEMLERTISALDQYKIDKSIESRTAFCSAARSFVDLQWKHMNREEQVLMPMAAQSLKKDDWERISDAFRSNENPLFGVKPKGDSSNLKDALSVLRR
ncbi:MAG: ATP-binding cassette domain-containing protein [Rhodocyclaceae bacterium]|nr:MAG: ATP-binding cassette domain-containing protein [Rhodocyclaceae bacterium]